MNTQEKSAIKRMIERFLEGESKYNSCLDYTWEIGRGGYDLLFELSHNNVPVCGVTRDGMLISRYEIEPCNESQECKDAANLIAEVMDKLGMKYERYSFEAKPVHTFTYSGHTFFADETYKIYTLDMEVFKIDNEKEGEFKIQADSFFGELLENITITDSDEKTIKALMKAHSNYDDLVSHAYGDLAVEYGLLQRVPYGEEDISFIDSLTDDDIYINDEVVEFSSPYDKYIDEDNETFYYEVTYDRQTENINITRMYQHDQVGGDITEEQLGKLYDKAQEIITDKRTKDKGKDEREL